MNNSFLLTGIKYIYWIRSYVLNTWACFGIFWYIWILIVSGSRFQGSFFSFWAVGALPRQILRWWQAVGRCGIVGLWGGGPGDEGTSWSQNCEDWIDPTWFCLNPKASRVSLEDSWSDAAKVRLQNSNSCRGWDLEMWQWRFWWRFCGVSTGTISAVKFGGVKELVFVDDIHISLLSGAGSRILLIAVKY